MVLRHDPEYTASHYDAYGALEWARHEVSWAARVSVAVHTRLLEEHVRDGDLVLDAGAGPGRFTIELARLGARVHVCDLSPVQLALNAERVAAAGYERAVVGRDRRDICDLAGLDDASFDVVVCFGGPLSYTLDRAHDAVAELVRVTRPGGHVLVGVMSAIGAMRAFLPQVLDEGRRYGPAYNDAILATGDLPRAQNAGHECHMFRWSELRTLLEPHGAIVGASAANFVTVGHDDVIAAASPEEQEQVLRWELELCREPGALDAGTHIAAVLRVA